MTKKRFVTHQVNKIRTFEAKTIELVVSLHEILIIHYFLKGEMNSCIYIENLSVSWSYIPGTVDGGTDLIGNANVAFAGERLSISKVDSLGSSSSRLQAVASGAAVHGGPRRIRNAPNSVAASRRNRAAALEIAHAGYETARDLPARDGMYGVRCACHQSHAHKNHACQLGVSHFSKVCIYGN